MKGRIPTVGEVPMHPLARQWAAYLCEDVREQNQNRWLGLARVLCWRCHFAMPGDPAKKCFCSREDNRGCPLVNAREDHYYWAFHS